MAMTKCKECGADVSTLANRCPSCGVARPGRSIGGMVLVLIIVLLVGFMVAGRGM